MGISRDVSIQAVLAGITGGGSIGIVAQLFELGFASTDVFAFGGAAIGAAATVLGAAWLTDRTDRKANAREQALLIDEFESLLAATQRSLDALPAVVDFKTYPDFGVAIRATSAQARETRDILKQAVERSMTLDFRQRALVIRLQYAVTGFLDWILDESPPHPLDERTYASTMNAMKDALLAAIVAIKRPGNEA